jgi:hypothetical protein
MRQGTHSLDFEPGYRLHSETARHFLQLNLRRPSSSFDAAGQAKAPAPPTRLPALAELNGAGFSPRQAGEIACPTSQASGSASNAKQDLDQAEEE